jgi:hypothetical protein
LKNEVGDAVVGLIFWDGAKEFGKSSFSPYAKMEK